MRSPRRVTIEVETDVGRTVRRSSELSIVFLDPLADEDGDGRTNLDEARRGRDPLSSQPDASPSPVADIDSSVGHLDPRNGLQRPPSPGLIELSSFSLPFNMIDLVFDPVRPYAYISTGAYKVAFVNLHTGIVEREFAFDHFPESGDHPDGSRLFVAELARWHDRYGSTGP
jgi:hypothetical protein